MKYIRRMNTERRPFASRAVLAVCAALTSIVALACSDDGSSTDGTGGGSTVGSGGSTTGSGGDATVGSGGGTVGSGGSGGGLGDPLFEGTIWVETHLKNGGVFEADGFGLFWEVGSASGSMEEWYEQILGSAAPLAPGECAMITQGAAPTYTPLSVGPHVYLRDGSTDLMDLLLYTSDTDYYGDGAQSVATALHAGAFSLAIDPGTATIPPMTSGQLGPLVDVTVPTGASCTVAIDCDLTAPPSETVDDMLYLFNQAYVCRGNPTTGDFTLTTDVLASDGDTIATVEAYAVKRQTAALGASNIDVLLVTRSQFLLDLQ